MRKFYCVSKESYLKDSKGGYEYDIVIKSDIEKMYFNIEKAIEYLESVIDDIKEGEGYLLHSMVLDEDDIILNEEVILNIKFQN